MASACEFQGNPDLYGLGIRIGIYTQVISTLITNHFLPGDFASTWTSNLIFVSALVVALVRSVSNAGDFYVAEGFVILQLILVYFLAVLSASGGVFVFLDYFAALLDGKISAETYQLMKDASKPEGRVIMSRHLSKLGRAYLDASPLRYTLRLVLALATSSLNLWFWISGVHSLRRETSGCSTSVFLFARVGVDGSVRSFFIVVSTFYVAYHLVIIIMGVRPQLKRKSTEDRENFKEVMLKALDPRTPAERLPEDKRTGLMTETTRSARQRKQQSVSRKVHLVSHLFMFTWSTVVIIYSILAVELTLAWNNVRSVYDVQSTGQFIPLFIGLVGLVRAVACALLEHATHIRKSRRRMPSIELKKDAVWHYWLNFREKATFKAEVPSKRWSFDDARTHSPAPPKRKILVFEPSEPVLPVPSSAEDLRLMRMYQFRRIKFPRVEWPSARFVYTDKSGRKHVFHDRLLDRRASWDFGRVMKDHPPVPKPHMARTALVATLKQRRQATRQERKRRRWWRRKLTRLETSRKTLKHDQIPELSEERWHHFRQTNSHDVSPQSDISISSSDVSGPPWLPPDVDNETLLWMRSYRDAYPPSSRSSVIRITRPNSYNDIKDAYEELNGHQMPFLVTDKPSAYEPGGSRRSFSSASSISSGSVAAEAFWQGFKEGVRERNKEDKRGRSRESLVYVRRPSSYSPNQAPKPPSRSSSKSGSQASDSQTKKRSGFFESVWGVVFVIMVAICNTFCLCGPCFGIYKFARSRIEQWQAHRFEQQNMRAPKEAPTRTKSGLFYCPECDQEFRGQRKTRGWYTIRPPEKDEKEKEKT